ncbi:MAG: proprotein convertase P-domain-containing protein [Saprospiraceae bacterium]|nr:proprotein convertase P-domain-containing protein [Saprospiraceae bacterium]
MNDQLYFSAARRFITLFIGIILSFFMVESYAQNKFEYLYRKNLTYEQRVRLGEQHFEINGEYRGNGYKQFERWKYWSRRSLNERGMIIEADQIDREISAFQAKNSKNGTQNAISGNLVEMGPMSTTNTSTWSSHLGRLTSISVANGNHNHIIVSAPSGGVWKTTNNGGSWTPIFDQMNTLNVYATEISHANSQHYFVGTDGSGIFRSLDGGVSWSTTTGIDAGDRINTITMHPTTSTTLYATGEFSGKLYRSTNSGANWATVFTSSFRLYDLEFKPGDSNTIYVSGWGEIYISTDNGATWPTPVSAPFAGAEPIMMAVTPANTDYIYALAATGGGFHAVYRSTDSGASWFTRSNNSSGTNNILTYNQGQLGGQAPRDMDIEVSPTNSEEVHVAGVETWKSTNGGSSWAKSTDWTVTEDPLPFIHADIDQLTYVTVGNVHRLYAATDGGIFYSDNGAVNWVDITQGIGTRQFYRIGASKTDVDRVVGGSQDNGAGIIRGGVWYDWLGADGMETFVDKNNANIIYGTTQRGGLNRSNDGGNSRIALPKPPNENNGSWVTPFEQDPTSANVIYAGYKQLHRSADGGSTWQTISNFNLTGVGTDTTLSEVKIAPSDNNTIYACYSNRMFRTTDGGTNWTPLNFPIGFFQINFITVHPTISNRLIITLSGGDGGAKFLESNDGGNIWTNITGNLPNIGAQCAVYEADAMDGIYVGMNPGLYYKNNTSGGNWTNVGNNLPNVSVTELEIQQNTLYVGTYGRGLWKAPLGGVTNVCGDYVATGLPLQIPDNVPTGVTSTINVTATGSITDVNIKNLSGTHSYIGDLIFTLKSPAGTIVTLIDRDCNDARYQDFNVGLDDAAAGALPCPYVGGVTAKPVGNLSDFNGQSPTGEWVLTVSDNFEEDAGSLEGWTLEICVSGGGVPCPSTIAVNELAIASGTYQAGVQLTSSGTVPNGNNVFFRAGNNVELQPNFAVQSTAIFEARIGGCQ